MTEVMQQNEEPLIDAFGRRIRLGDLTLYGGSGEIFIVVPEQVICAKHNPEIIGYHRTRGTLICKGITQYSDKNGKGFRRRKKEFGFGTGVSHFLIETPFPRDFEYNTEYKKESNWRYEDWEEYPVSGLVVVDREFILAGGKPDEYTDVLFELQNDVRQELGLPAI